MSAEKRKSLIKQIEEERDSRIITYITGDRPGLMAEMADDAVRPVVEQLRRLGSLEKLDVFLYSRGGGIDVPWQLVSAFREISEEWSVLIPFRAYSATTLLALGADEIIMGPQAQLGPIDPSLTQHPLQGIGKVPVEDVMAFIDFMRNKVGLSDQLALTNGLANLVGRVDAVTLGTVYRTYSHIRDTARKIIQSRKEPPTSSDIDQIISTLAEKVYAHGHAISRTEAKVIGLPVESPLASLEDTMWNLLLEYESHMKLLEPWDPQAVLGEKEEAEEKCVVAMIESTAASHECIIIPRVIRKRQMPQNLQVVVNLTPKTPDSVIQEKALRAVQEALMTQAPPLGIETIQRPCRWVLAE